MFIISLLLFYILFDEKKEFKNGATIPSGQHALDEFYSAGTTFLLIVICTFILAEIFR